MFYQIGKRHIWVSDEFSFEQTVDYLVKKLTMNNKLCHRAKIIKLVENQRK